MVKSVQKGRHLALDAWSAVHDKGRRYRI